MSLQIQFFTFFMMFSAGWMLGVWFDVYRVVSKSVKLSKWLISLLDIVYWCLATIIVFRILYMSNQGEVRFFIFLAMFMGTWFHFAFTSIKTMKLVEWMIKIIQRIIQIGIRCFEVLIIRPIILLYRLFIIIFGIITAIAMFISKIVVQLFYPTIKAAKWLYNRLYRIVFRRN